VLLAGIGLYSVLPLSVSQRRREIAVRLALGASPRGVLPLTVREGMTLVAIGRRCGWSDIGDAAAEGDVVRDECLRSADVRNRSGRTRHRRTRRVVPARAPGRGSWSDRGPARL